MRQGTNGLGLKKMRAPVLQAPSWGCSQRAGDAQDDDEGDAEHELPLVCSERRARILAQPLPRFGNNALRCELVGVRGWCDGSFHFCGLLLRYYVLYNTNMLIATIFTNTTDRNILGGKGV